MCEGEDEPLCVKWCLNDVLVYEEREVWVEEETKAKKREELDVGMESLADKYGRDKLMDAMARMKEKD